MMSNQTERTIAKGISDCLGELGPLPLSEQGRALILDLVVAANNVATGHAQLDTRLVAEKALGDYVADLEHRLEEAVGEWDALVVDRRTLMAELAALSAAKATP